MISIQSYDFWQRNFAMKILCGKKKVSIPTQKIISQFDYRTGTRR